MNYKTIVVHVDPHPTAAARIRLAIGLARHAAAQLTAATVLRAMPLPVLLAHCPRCAGCPS